MAASVPSTTRAPHRHDTEPGARAEKLNWGATSRAVGWWIATLQHVQEPDSYSRNLTQYLHLIKFIRSDVFLFGWGVRFGFVNYDFGTCAN